MVPEPHRVEADGFGGLRHADQLREGNLPFDLGQLNSDEQWPWHTRRVVAVISGSDCMATTNPDDRANHRTGRSDESWRHLLAGGQRHRSRRDAAMGDRCRIGGLRTLDGLRPHPRRLTRAAPAPPPPPPPPSPPHAPTPPPPEPPSCQPPRPPP